MKGCILLYIIFLLFNCYPSQAQEKALPKRGDGIVTFLRRHNRSEAVYQKEFIELNKGKFGKNNTLQWGVAYQLPPLKTQTASAPSPKKPSSSPKKKQEPLFGKNLASYEILSTELKGACFYVVCGHGGPDPGAIGKMGKYELHEDEYAYDISLRLARNLLMRGALVYIIIQDAQDGIREERILKNSKRETCMGSRIPLNQIERLNQRSNKINALYHKDKPAYSRAIFIHIDSRSKHKSTDVFFYHSNSRESRSLALTMRNTFSQKYRIHQPNRGFTGYVEHRKLHVLNKTQPTSLFVELGNIQNSYDQQRIVLNNNRQALANWLCEGFILDYKHSRKK
ncbi:N-acetylmuramoyl-L-alanine amidase [Parabacteroides sp. 52]|uniref:N-acetylmuramoyl-L-alanine amidase family protein n=1 Tax=unclassified Parabacteroides TaxID=2649774 RepID=UPI0013D0B47C|nr:MULTISPECIES: N-acetylmuramoyl-L-alanine amidase [unclassified Parabacteroides]MDH6534459.1 N-acetylmuramoyl-L-alanine amidase [Parabacteroides sp. PM5-20]NDV55092.1 N-acetylmuramoyl-L-alanine amidase [Parabacteroides sp. 52]